MHCSQKTHGRILLPLACALSLLALSACAERDDGDTTLAQQANDDAATAPATTTLPPAAPARTPPAQAAQPQAGMAGQQAANGQLGDADRQFLAQASASNQHELHAAQIGIERAQDADVKAYAERMQRDHTALGERMQPLVQQAGVSPAPMDAGAMPTLENATGEAFDRAFMEMMVGDHEKVVASFQAAASGQEHASQVRAIASEVLPILEEHLQQAQEIRDGLSTGGDGAQM